MSSPPDGRDLLTQRHTPGVYTPGVDRDPPSQKPARSHTFDGRADDDFFAEWGADSEVEVTDRRLVKVEPRSPVAWRSKWLEPPPKKKRRPRIDLAEVEELSPKPPLDLRGPTFDGCPYCQSTNLYVERVDVGVGMMQCAPAECLNCGAHQVYATHGRDIITELEEVYGWCHPDEHMPPYMVVVVPHRPWVAPLKRFRHIMRRENLLGSPYAPRPLPPSARFRRVMERRNVAPDVPLQQFRRIFE